MKPLATAPRLVHRATDALSAQAERLMEEGFNSRLSAREIASQLRAIGTAVAERTISRRAAEWRAERLRAAALRQLGNCAPSIWDVADLLALVRRVDIRPGWWKRSRRRLQKALRAFWEEPTPERIRLVESELLIFAVSAHLARRPAADNRGHLIVLKTDRLKPGRFGGVA